MVTFEEAASMLDEAVDELPQEIFDKLNGGVNLIPSRRTDEHGLLVMGMYIVDQMGRHVEIYYGSFKERYRNAPPERWKRELTKTLKHELTHHIESLACDRSLEKWDAEHVAKLLSGLEYEPLEASSVLFVDADGAGLAPMASVMFGHAALDMGCPDLSSSYDVALCMTEEQGDSLAERWPEFDERIICLGESDIRTPKLETQGAWNRLAGRIAEEIRCLMDELMGETGDEDT